MRAVRNQVKVSGQLARAVPRRAAEFLRGPCAF